jgi:hypothetical protein
MIKKFLDSIKNYINQLKANVDLPPLNSSSVKLPLWAKVVPNHTPKEVSLRIEVDTPKAFKEWFGLLRIQQPNQYLVNLCYYCVKQDIVAALKGTKFDPARLEVVFAGRLDFDPMLLPAGRGANPQQHYARVRGK